MPFKATSPIDLGTCSVHGQVEARAHKVGVNYAGAPRISWRCLVCHNQQALASRGLNHDPVAAAAPASLGFCNASVEVSGAKQKCRRPFGHPADFHKDETHGFWPVRVDYEY